jgi:hypothetical protein
VVVKAGLTSDRLTFVATTVLAALHIRSAPRGETGPPRDMAGV